MRAVLSKSGIGCMFPYEIIHFTRMKHAVDSDWVFAFNDARIIEAF
jgi:hypothetical protein